MAKKREYFCPTRTNLKPIGNTSGTIKAVGVNQIGNDELLRSGEKRANMGFFRPIPKERGIKGAIGAESEAVIAAALIQAGYTVLTPNGYMHRYDLVIEDAEGKFWRIQCKTAWLSSDQKTLKFQGCSTLQKGQKGRMITRRNHYQGEVDYFAVYSPDTRKVYLLPISDVGNTENCLRLVPTGNRQERKVKYAADYEL